VIVDYIALQGACAAAVVAVAVVAVVVAVFEEVSSAV